jgi:hypothetical protein
MELAVLNRSLGEMQAQWQIQELQLELISLTAKLPARSLNVARRFLEGNTILECGALSGIRGATQEEVKTKVGDILRDPKVKTYLDLAKQIMTAQAMQHVAYDKAQWMQDMLTVLRKATGAEDVNVVTHFEGTASSDRVKKDDLAAAKATLELLGKSQGWLVDNKNIQVSAVEKVRVRDFTHDRPDEDEDNEIKNSPGRVDLAPHFTDQLVKIAVIDDDDESSSRSDDDDDATSATSATSVPDWE